MILVDTSIWIDLLKKKPARSIREVDLLRFVTCGPVAQEVLQGLRPGHQSDMFRSSFLALPLLSDPISIALYLSASEIYRQGRRRGISIRSSTDCLIAAIAIENCVPVWHQDRDFDAIAKYTSLEIVRPGLCRS
jgi:predicted nucleic acid-binding protein